MASCAICSWSRWWAIFIHWISIDPRHHTAYHAYHWSTVDRPNAGIEFTLGRVEFFPATLVFRLQSTAQRTHAYRRRDLVLGPLDRGEISRS